MAASLDGAIARHAFESTQERMASGFTNRTDQEMLKELVTQCGAVLIGWRSIRAETGAFYTTVKEENRAEPEWIVFSHSGDVDFSHPFWRQERIPKSIFLCQDFSPKAPPTIRHETHTVRGMTVTSRSGTMTGLLAFLATRNTNRVALLGGGQLNAIFWKNQLPQRLFLTLSPQLLGRGATIPLMDSLPEPRQLKLVRQKKRGSFLFLEYETTGSAHE